MITTALSKLGLISKGVIGAAFMTAAFTFVATESLTRNYTLAIVMSSVFAALSAYFAARPKTIAALAAAEALRNQVAENSTASMIKRMTEFHAEQIKGKDNQLTVLVKEIALLRYSKHKCLEALNSAEVRVRNYESYMRDHNLNYHDQFGAHYVSADRAELFREENKQLLEIGQIK